MFKHLFECKSTNNIPNLGISSKDFFSRGWNLSCTYFGKHLVAIDKLGSAVFKAFKPFADDGIHFFVGIGTRCIWLQLSHQVHQDRLHLFLQPSLQFVITGEHWPNLFQQFIVDMDCSCTHDNSDCLAAKIHKFWNNAVFSENVYSTRKKGFIKISVASRNNEVCPLVGKDTRKNKNKKNYLKW